MLRPDWRVVEHQLGIISTSGCMRPLAAQADGMLCGEACGAVVLERAAASGMGHVELFGGSHVQNQTSVSLWAADSNGMAAAIHSALESSEVPGSKVSLVHLHAMGSAISDNAEVLAVLKSLAVASPREQPLVVLAHKASIGHSVEAAGVIAVILTTLALRHSLSPQLIKLEEFSRKLRLTKKILVPTHAVVPVAGVASISGTSVSGDNVNLLLGGPGKLEAVLVTKWSMQASESDAGSALLGLSLQREQDYMWERSWPQATCSYMAHHHVGCTPVAPGTGYLCMVRSASSMAHDRNQLAQLRSVQLVEIQFSAMLFLDTESCPLVHTLLTDQGVATI